MCKRLVRDRGLVDKKKRCHKNNEADFSKCNRRTKNSKGVYTERAYKCNYACHVDGYQLKPFEFCIQGCIDGFSRRII